jgi:hypothetical protein
MEMALSAIIDLRFFLRRRDLRPGVNVTVERLKLSKYGSSDLASPDRSWIFSHGRREEYYPRNNFLGCYVLDNGDSYSRLPSDVDQVVRLFCSDMLGLVLLPMLIDYFNGYARACSLGIAAQIKIMVEPSLVFTGLWFDLFGCLLKSIRLCHGRKKSLKTSKICSFLLDFILLLLEIPCTLYSYKYMWY